MLDWVGPVVLVLAALLGCGQRLCAPGATQRCVCTDGSEGAQSCNAEGRGWNDCECAAAQTSEPSSPSRSRPPAATKSPQPATSDSKRAERIATRLLLDWEAGRYRALGDDFSSTVRARLGPAQQREGHAQTKAMFGAFESMEFAEMVPLGKLRVFRFRGTFSDAKGEARPEVRVVLDADDKVAGLWCRPWSPTLN